MESILKVKNCSVRNKNIRSVRMEECIFCKIVNGKIKSRTIYENDKVLSFLDVNPRSPGHSLVIPKKHVETLDKLDGQTAGEILKVAKKVEKLLKKSLSPEAFTLGINDGEAAGQEVPHLHLNIIPRFKNDGGKPIHSVVNNPPEKELSEIENLILEEKK
ncbi:MAG: HIT family protein [Candidatus Hadarchaeia archaeon]